MSVTRIAGVAGVLWVLSGCCGGNPAAVCETNDTLTIASPGNGLQEIDMPVRSAVAVRTDASEVDVLIANFEQDEDAPFVDRPDSYIQLDVKVYAQSGELRAADYRAGGGCRTLIDVFLHPSIGPTVVVAGDDVGAVGVGVVEDDRVCGTLDIDDGSTVIEGTFDAGFIEPSVF